MSADTTWPAGLTRTPRVSSLSEEAPDVLVRSEVDVGPPKLRRRFTGDRRKFTVELDLMRSEVAIFDAWFLNNSTGAGGGSRSFAWKHPRLGTAADFRFLSVPTYRPRAPRGDGTEWWLVAFDVEMLPGTDSSIPTPGGGADPYGGGNWTLFAMIRGDNESLSLSENEDNGRDDAIFSGAVFEADPAPPILLMEIVTKNYGIEFDEGEDDEDAVVSGAPSSSSSVTVHGSSSTIPISGDS
jgi:hypothetical protein